MDVRGASWRRLSAGEPMILNYSAGKDTWDPLDCKEIKPVNPKGNQPWIFVGRVDTEADSPILWLPNAKSNSWENILMLGNIEGKYWKRRGMAEEKMVR